MQWMLGTVVTVPSLITWHTFPIFFTVPILFVCLFCNGKSGSGSDSGVVDLITILNEITIKCSVFISKICTGILKSHHLIFQ